MGWLSVCDGLCAIVKEMKCLLMGLWVLVLSLCVIILQIHLQLGMLFSTGLQHGKCQVPFLGVCPNFCLLDISAILECVVVLFLGHMLKQCTVLSGYADCASYIHSGVECLTPFGVSHRILIIEVECLLLFPDGLKWALVLGLC